MFRLNLSTCRWDCRLRFPTLSVLQGHEALINAIELLGGHRCPLLIASWNGTMTRVIALRECRIPFTSPQVALSIMARAKILLEKRADNGWWGLPGGHVDVGESVEQTAIREIWEETGIRTRIRRLVGIYSDPQYNVIGAYSDGLIHFVVVIFECEYLSGELEVSEESTDVGYFPARNLPAKTLLCDVQAITDAVENRIQPFVR